jgi:flagellar biosynthetic protein FliP
MNPKFRKWMIATTLALAAVLVAAESFALPLPTLQVGIDDIKGPEQMSSALQVLLLLTVLALAPSILIMMTSFSRIIIVLAFLRQAMGTQQTPPTQILIGLGLFLTLFVMAPVWTEINDNALKPYLSEEISQWDALKEAEAPLRKFMLRQTREKDLALFVNLENNEKPETSEEVRMQTLIPAFIISELKTAFQIGFLIYIPFLILDMVVASILLSMGMLMLPPILISLPFKLMLFVMVDGWYLTVGSLMKSFS